MSYSQQKYESNVFAKEAIPSKMFYTTFILSSTSVYSSNDQSNCYDLKGKKRTLKTATMSEN